MRKTAKIVIGPEGGRDAGKSFVITEMSAADAARWGRQAFQGLAKGNTELPEDANGADLPTIASLGFKAIASLKDEETENLLDQLMRCVTYLPDPNRPEIKRGGAGQALFADDIEEYRTQYRLQAEAFELSLGFSMAGVRSAFQWTPAVIQTA